MDRRLKKGSFIDSIKLDWTHGPVSFASTARGVGKTGAPAAVGVRGSSPLSPTIIFNNLHYPMVRQKDICAQNRSQIRAEEMVYGRLEVLIGQVRRNVCGLDRLVSQA